MDNSLIIGIGEILWDIFPEGKRIGGAPANFAYHASQFGNTGMAISAIGCDTLGEDAIKAINGKLAFHFDRVNFPTGTVKVTLDREGIPAYEIMKNVAWDNIPWSEELEKIAVSTSAVCFGTLAQRNPISRITIRKFIEMVNQNQGTLRILDLNLRSPFYNRNIISDSIKLCNILKINDSELSILQKMYHFKGNMEEVAEKIMYKYELEALILTRGTDGSHVFTPGMESYYPTPKVNVVDTVGAGDAFTGAFCGAVLQGKTPTEAHKIAVDISAFVCTQPGAMPAIPNDLVK